MAKTIQKRIDWIPDVRDSGMPLYLAIADAIGKDVAEGRLAAGDRLPPQRHLAGRLDVDFTTVARAYVEAQSRGLVNSTVGRGTFIAEPAANLALSHHASMVDFSMNMPPEPDDPDLIARMERGFAEIGRDVVDLLRYQSFGGAPGAKRAASGWLERRGILPVLDQLFITSGAHAALFSIFSILAKPGRPVLAEEITYPGIRSIAAQLGIKISGLKMDEQGIDPDALEKACKEMAPVALYLNPALQNPTTMTMPQARRQIIADIARRFRLPVIEDDAYSFILDHGPAPFAALIPDLTWYIAGLSKCLGAGLRCAYVMTPDVRSAWSFVASSRAATVMASPLTVALATRWIEDGTGEAMIRFIRKEAAARQSMAREVLGKYSFCSDPLSFNLWLSLPAPWTRSAFVGQMQSKAIGIVPSDAFVVEGPIPEAVRVCLGGPTKRHEIHSVLEFMAHILEESPALASNYL